MPTLHGRHSELCGLNSHIYALLRKIKDMQAARSLDMITPESTIKAVEDHVSCDMAKEEVVLNVKSGVYYGLDEIGTMIWKLVQPGLTVEQVVDAVTSEYDVGREQCEKDMINFFTDLESYGLIEVS
jgi:hypothetical protein